MNDTTFVMVLAIAAALAAFQQWMRRQRRLAIHRERLAAIEKGIQLPPVEREVRRRTFNVQRMLLFAGLIWLSIGLASVLTLDALVDETFHVQWGHDRVGNPVWVPVLIRDGMQWAGLALIGIGLSHLVIYALGRKQPSGD